MVALFDRPKHSILFRMVRYWRGSCGRGLGSKLVMLPLRGTGLGGGLSWVEIGVEIRIERDIAKVGQGRVIVEVVDARQARIRRCRTRRRGRGHSGTGTGRGGRVAISTDVAFGALKLTSTGL